VLAVALTSVARREEGQDLVEYALVAALVAFGATTDLQSPGQAFATAFTNTSTTWSSSFSKPLPGMIAAA